MAVTRLGTYTLQQSSTANSSFPVTVPDGAVACVVIVSGYPGTGYTMLDTLNWDGGGLDFSLIVDNYWAVGDKQIGAYIMTSASAGWPGTGSKTLYYSATNCFEGLNIIVLFYSGVNVSSPLVGYQSSNGYAVSWTSSISGVIAGDMGIIGVYSYATDYATVNANSQTQIYSTAGTPYNFAEIAVAEKAGTGALSFTHNGGAGGASVPLAIALKASAGDEHSGTALLSGGGALSVQTGSLRSGASAIAAAGNLSASGRKAASKGLAITGAGNIAAVGHKIGSYSLLVSGGGLLGIVQRSGHSGALLLTGAGQILAVGTHQESGTGTVLISAGGDISIQGRSAKAGSAQLSLSGVLSAFGSKSGLGGLLLSAGGSLGTIHRTARSASLGITGAGTILAIGNQHEPDQVIDRIGLDAGFDIGVPLSADSDQAIRIDGLFDRTVVLQGVL